MAQYKINGQLVEADGVKLEGEDGNPKTLRELGAVTMLKVGNTIVASMYGQTIGQATLEELGITSGGTEPPAPGGAATLIRHYTSFVENEAAADANGGTALAYTMGGSANNKPAWGNSFANDAELAALTKLTIVTELPLPKYYSQIPQILLLGTATGNTHGHVAGCVNVFGAGGVSGTTGNSGAKVTFVSTNDVNMDEYNYTDTTNTKPSDSSITVALELDITAKRYALYAVDTNGEIKAKAAQLPALSANGLFVVSMNRNVPAYVKVYNGLLYSGADITVDA